MKKILHGVMALSLVTAISCKQKDVEIKSEEDKTLYTVGTMFGERLSAMKLSEPQIHAISTGLREAASGKQARVNAQEYAPKVRDFFNERMKSMSEDNKKTGTDFLDKFVTAEGATKTESGLAFKIIQEGTGAYAKAEDTVRVHYHGTLIDGTVFDSSVERGEPATFKLNEVIAAWTEGLQLMHEGDKWILYVPYEIGFGERGSGSQIPPYAALIFEVELIKVN